MGKMEGAVNSSPLSPPFPEAPLFTSAHGALKFALNFAHGSTKRSWLAKLMGGPIGEGKGLGGLDGAAQAGMILAEVQSLGSVRYRIIVARFMAPSVPCACKAQCCRGYRAAPEWDEAIELLTEHVLACGLTGTISHHRLRRALVVRYFGIKDSFIEIANSCGVHRQTASQYHKAVVEHFRAEETVAFTAIEGRLYERGIVGAT